MSFSYIAPSRPLPPACRWLLQDGSAHLLWNAGCIAHVTRDRDGRWHSKIQWQQIDLEARCGSREQGMRWIDRWMEKRTGLPGSGCRRAVRKPGWMAAFDEMSVGSPLIPSRTSSSFSNRRDVPAYPQG